MKNKMREALAESFLTALSEERLPWQKGWSTAPNRNAVTGKWYHGINALWLGMTAGERGYTDPRWCTFNQAKSRGWQIKKGEHGTPIEFWSLYDREKKKNISQAEAERLKQILSAEEFKERIQPVARTYTVFNGEQIEGIPVYEKPEHEYDREQAEDIRKRVSEGMGFEFSEGGDRAFYSPLRDCVTMPDMDSFFNEYEYIATFLHEASHASGHESRLNRKLDGGFGSERYAREELRAEISAAFLAQSLGLQAVSGKEHMKNHKAYIQSWIRVIRDDRNELFQAIKDAEKIADYVMEKGNLKEFVEQEHLVSELEQKITDFIHGDRKTTGKPLSLGKTPRVLGLVGADEELELVISKKTIEKCMRPEIRDEDGKLSAKTGHALSMGQLISSIEEITCPDLIIKGTRENSLVAVLNSSDDKGRKMIAAIHLDKRTRRSEINEIASIYGRDKFEMFLQKRAENGEILAINKNIAESMLRSVGAHCSSEYTLICYDDSITQDTGEYKPKNVKISDLLRSREESYLREHLPSGYSRSIPFPMKEEIDRIEEIDLSEVERIQRIAYLENSLSIPPQERFTEWFGDYSIWEAKKGISPEELELRDRQLRDMAVRKMERKFGDFFSFSTGQRRIIDLGLFNNLSMEQVERYAVPDFNTSQMHQIRVGMQNGLSAEQVSEYARPELDFYRMQKVREDFEKENMLRENHEKNPEMPEKEQQEMKLFLLSVEEVKALTEEQRKTHFNGKPCVWWLRSPGIRGHQAMSVHDYGDVYACHPHFITYDYGIRPVMQMEASVCNTLPAMADGVVLFGKNPSTEETAPWYVIGEKDGIVSLFSRDIMSVQCFNEFMDKGNDFMKSDLAEYMNTELVSKLFTPEEQKLILPFHLPEKELKKEQEQEIEQTMPVKRSRHR